MDYESKSTEELEALRKSIMDDICHHEDAITALNNEYAPIRDIIVARRKAELEAEREGQHETARA